MPVCPAQILTDVIALKSQFPQLAGMNQAHIDELSLRYAHGQRWVPNESYDAELAAWRAEETRRAVEDEDGNRRKRHLNAPPSKQRIAWDDDGISLYLSLIEEPMAHAEVGAAVTFPIPGYETIALESAYGRYRARLPGCRVDLELDGPRHVAALRTAVFDLLRLHAAHVGEEHP